MEGWQEWVQERMRGKSLETEKSVKEFCCNSEQRNGGGDHG